MDENAFAVIDSPDDVVNRCFACENHDNNILHDPQNFLVFSLGNDVSPIKMSPKTIKFIRFQV